MILLVGIATELEPRVNKYTEIIGIILLMPNNIYVMVKAAVALNVLELC
jgi:hypothetical protein